MGNSKTTKSYIKIYQQYFGIIIPKNFDIHHLDLNPENNEIENLLMLPEKVHSQLHNSIKTCSYIEFTPEIKSVNEPGNKSNELSFDYASIFIEVYRECCKWKDYKEFLLGNLPNIHKIEI
jgi:hypothetical protein